MSDGVYDAFSGRPIYYVKPSKEIIEEKNKRKKSIEECADYLKWDLSEFFISEWPNETVVDDKDSVKIIICSKEKIEAFEKINGELNKIYEKLK